MNEHTKIQTIIKNDHPQTIYINESGFYSLVCTSKMPEAIKFRKWVTSEVLPSIRKTGSYTVNNYNNLEKYNGKDCVYILHIKDNIYKYGKSSELKDRLNNHNNNLSYIQIIKIYVCESMNKMKDMPGMDNIQNILKQMGMAGGLPNMGKNAKVNVNAMQGQLNRLQKNAKLKENLKKKAEMKHAQKLAQQFAEKVAEENNKVAQSALTDDELIAYIGESAKDKKASKSKKSKINK
jgi:prophage antirepressor-like protein